MSVIVVRPFMADPSTSGTLWRIKFCAGELGDGAIGDYVSSSDQYLPVGEQRRRVKFADVVHVSGASERPGVG